MNPAARHHFLPVFYLRRWASAGHGRLVEFSRPYGPGVKPRRTAPAGTGYIERLYAPVGQRRPGAQRLEETFFRPADDYASKALRLIESNDRELERSVRHRSAWSFFLMSLMMRMPPDIAALKAAYPAQWQRMGFESQERLSAAEFEELALEALTTFVDHRHIGHQLNNLHWFMIETPADHPEYLTSDQPLVMYGGLQNPRGYIFLPIGPHRSFWGLVDRRGEAEVRNKHGAGMIEVANELVVSQAHRLAFGSSDAPLMFIQQHLARNPHVSLFARADARFEASYRPIPLIRHE